MKKEMIEKGIVLPDAVTYWQLILGLLLQRRLSEARGLSPDEVTYTYLMTACCVEGEFSKVFHLHDEMINKGFLPDIVRETSPSLVAYNALIYGYCSLDRAEEAVGLLRGMVEMSLSPDTVSYSLVISGFCRIWEMKKAYDMKDDMYDQEGISELDEITYSSLMEGLSDEVAYTSLVNAYLDEGDYFKVAQLNDELANYDYTYLPNIVSFSVYFNGLGRKAWTRETNACLLRHIYSCSTVPIDSIYDTLIENCSNNEFDSLVELVEGFCRRGLENAYDTMLQWNYKPDGAFYNLFILEHCNCDNVHKAYNMYMEMVHYGFASHMLYVLTLIKSLSREQMDNEVSWVIQNTLRSCDLNDSELHNALMEIDIKGNEVGTLINVLAEKAIDGLLLNGGKCLIGSGPKL
ncbi:pentatricopeptide repeat-containing protein At5g39710-like [Lotus japonicus]|uniref:pentatricopeptide repeat-containing protein At5g39710-like n=1 Tax=Lotus japonicus TaxID=34305 RepID=UPI00258B6BCF|nr:pentatricopeptide repeat-containing protein At5g39710-like [Lotus japonicus]